MQKKQKKLKLVLSPPSIPTSFQTFRYSESEDNAFNTSQSRFVEGTVCILLPYFRMTYQAQGTIDAMSFPKTMLPSLEKGSEMDLYRK